MDVNRLRTGEKIAGASGIALLLIMFIFDWFSVDVGGGASFGGNAWDTMDLIRWLLLLTSLAAIALAATSASSTQVNLPVALSAIVAGLGALSVLFVLIRIISPPDGGLGDLINVGRSIGVFLGFIAAAGVAYGGFVAMQEEGTSFSDQADRLQGGGGPGNDPPPPPRNDPPPPPPPTA